MRPDDPIVQEMKKVALEASRNAYCVYSKFPVGAAVLTESGEIFGGCNVENASYGLTICAERNAIFQAVAKGHYRIRAIAVVTPTDLPTPPCGACRQVINEFGPEAEIFSFTENGKVSLLNLKDLLPEAFGPGNLGHEVFVVPELHGEGSSRK